MKGEIKMGKESVQMQFINAGVYHQAVAAQLELCWS